MGDEKANSPVPYLISYKSVPIPALPVLINSIHALRLLEALSPFPGWWDLQVWVTLAPDPSYVVYILTSAATIRVSHVEKCMCDVF